MPGTGVGRIPVPCKAEEPDAVALFTVNKPFSEPVIVGVNVNVTVHVTPAARDKPFEQVPPVFVKSPALVPVIVENGVESVTEVLPVFFTVAVSAALVVPTVVSGKDTGAGVT